MTKRSKLKDPPSEGAHEHSEAEREFAQIVDAFEGDQAVQYGGGKGFGSSALKVDGKIFAMISSRGQFVAKLPLERVDELVRSGIGNHFDPGRGKLMKEWVALNGGYSWWIKLAKEARQFAGR